MKSDSRIWVAGHRGLVGSALARNLNSSGYTNLILRTSDELDLTRQKDVEDFFEKERPEYVFIAAARVGGIIANRDAPVEFLLENALIALNIIGAAAKFAESKELKKLVFLGSSCIYPKFAEQPIKEEALLTGSLETSNEAYALAKIIGLKLVEYQHRQHGYDFISAMPANLYGPGDNFHHQHSHVIPGLLRRFHEAKESKQSQVAVWGTGKALREFLYVDDLADALIFLMQNYSDSKHINVGSGEEVSVKELAEIVAETVGYKGALVFDSTIPDGTPRKVMDHSKIKELGWKSKTTLRDGLKKTYQCYLENQDQIRGMA